MSMRITVDDGRARAFDRSSPVYAYWLANCEGFIVESPGREGVVEEVGLAGEHAAFLVVRYGRTRREHVHVEAVRAVVPADELIVVQGEAPPARLAPLAAGARVRADALARSGARASGTAVSTVGRTTGAAAAGVWRGTSRSAAALREATGRNAPLVGRRIRDAGLAAWRQTRRVALAIRREARRLWAWGSPRAAATARGAARRTAAATTVAAAAVERFARTHGPPARRAVERAVSTAALRARERLDGLRHGREPESGGVTPGEHQRQPEHEDDGQDRAPRRRS
jgi:hypothetical protein